MFNLKIHRFGPIIDADISIRRLEILIGPQSSGKSTIAKLVYFFLHIRDEVTAFILEPPESNDSWAINNALQKRLRNRFLEFFGPTPQPADVKIRFTYCESHYLEITLDKKQHKYLSLIFSPNIWNRILTVLSESKEAQKSIPKHHGFISSRGRIVSDQERVTISEKVRDQCNNIFRFDKDLFFIPAGRSLLSTLTDQIQYIHPHQLDFPMRRFVEAVNSTKAFFDKSLDDLILERQALSTERLFFSAIRKAQGHVKRILRGEYRYDKEGGKILVSSGIYTKLSFASSGQQEVIWILLSLFFLVLEKSKALVFVEEPEAHLFPNAQKEIMDFIAFVFNELNCDFFITTHSPYILSSINNLLYAYELGHEKKSGDVRHVVPDEQWLKQTEVGGYFVNDGNAINLLNEEMSVLRTELLDQASVKINAQYEELLEIERGLYGN